MNPSDIARLITEDLDVCNGVIVEGITGTIDINEINPANYPYLDAAKKIGLPTYLLSKKINLNNFYGVLSNYANTTGGKLTYAGIQGAGYDKETLPLNWPKAMTDLGDGAAKIVTIVTTVRDKDDDVPIDQIVKFARGKRGSNFNPEDWARAIRNYPLIKDVPSVFTNYDGLLNDTAKAILLVSGIYSDGLYIVPTEVIIDGNRLPWDDAIKLFTSDPSGYGGEHANIEDRIRLRFRKFLEKTNQGAYIHRANRNPDSIIKSFLASNSIGDFLQSIE